MSLCPECLGRGFVYSPGGYAPKLVCPTCEDDEGAFHPEPEWAPGLRDVLAEALATAPSQTPAKPAR